MSTAEIKLRAKLANNGRTAANDRAGIRVGSDLHLAEMILAERDALLAALKLAENVLSHAPFSTEIWPNGIHPNEGITQIRDAIAEAEGRS